MWVLLWAEDLNNALWHSAQYVYFQSHLLPIVQQRAWLGYKKDFSHREVLIQFLLAVLRSISGAHIFLVHGGNNSFTTPFSRGSCLTTCFLRCCIRIKCPWVNTCNLHIHVVHGQVLNTFRSMKRKKPTILPVFYIYMLKDCFRLVLKYPKRQQATLYMNDTWLMFEEYLDFHLETLRH